MRLLDVLRRVFAREPPAPPAPAAPAEGDPERVSAVQAVLDELRPAFAADGGDVELASVAENGWVTVRFVGACRSCAAQMLTQKAALEPRLSERLEWFAGLRTE